jgi:two-component system, LytTR family, sensor kinase
MQKFIDWYLKFYPPNGVPLNRRIAIHSTYWLVWGLFSMMAFIGENSFEDKLVQTVFLIVQGCLIYYGITYFAAPNLFSSKRFVFGLMILCCIYGFNY